MQRALWLSNRPHAYNPVEGSWDRPPRAALYLSAAAYTVDVMTPSKSAAAAFEAPVSSGGIRSGLNDEELAAALEVCGLSRSPVPLQRQALRHTRCACAWFVDCVEAGRGARVTVHVAARL